MVVARSMNNRKLADQLRMAATSVALEMGGWAPAKTAKQH